LDAWSGEGGDRSELANAGQDKSVNTVADNCNNTIVVINTTGMPDFGRTEARRY
jgi:beta-glucosidase